MYDLPAGALLLAPMVELSHRPLRSLIAGWGGCDRYYTEMCSASAFLANTAYEAWFMDTQPLPGATAVQLYATNTDDVALAAGRLKAEFAAEGRPLAGVDINFGCAAPHIERSGGGVAWMQRLDASCELVSKARQAVPGIPLSAKLRLGYKESLEELGDYAAGLEAAGLDYLSLHPRLKHEKFRRSSRWDYVAALAQRLGIPVVGNGDIRSPLDYRRAMDRYRPAGIMIGREAVRRPWIFALIRGKTENPDYSLEVDLLDCAMRMLDLIREQLPVVFHLSRARRFFFYFSENLSFGHHLCFKIQNSQSLLAIADHLHEYFREVPKERLRIEA